MGNGDAIFTFAIFFVDNNYPNNWLKYLFNKLNISTISIVAAILASLLNSVQQNNQF